MQINDNIGHIMADDNRQTGSLDVEEMLSIGEAADLIGVSVDTLRRWSKKGRVLTYRSPGGHRYYKRKDLINLFDTKYTRDEPTIRSSGNKDNITNELEKDHQEPILDQLHISTHQPSQQFQEEIMDIPQMQPVQVVNLQQKYPGYSMPGLSAPPPPMPQEIEQPKFEVDVRSPVTDQNISPASYYRHPASPIGADISHSRNGMGQNVNATIISDYTTGGGFSEERLPEDTSRFNDFQKIDPNRNEQINATAQHQNTQQQTKGIEDQIDLVAHDTITPPSPQIVNSQTSDTQIRQEHLEEPRPQLETTNIKSQEYNIKTISDHPQEPTDQITPSRMEYIEPQTEQIVSEKKDHSDQRPASGSIVEKKEVTSIDNTKTDKVINEIFEKDTIRDRSQVEEADQVKEESKDQQKRSILEPEGIEASRMNSLEKMEDEGWFAKNKTNILIGFTVFLLIDIILFIIWLTTSRILSPIP